MKISKTHLAYILIIGVIIFVNFRFDFFIAPDTWERIRIAEYIALNGAVPVWDDSIVQGRYHLYPPLTDVFLAYAYILTHNEGDATGISQFVLIAKIFSVLLFTAFVSAVYTLSRKLDISPIYPLLFILSYYLIFRRFESYVAETLGLFLFISFSYYLLEMIAAGKNKLTYGAIAGLMTGMLISTHIRSASTLICVLMLFLLILAVKRKRKEIKNIIIVIATGMIISSAWWFDHTEQLMHLKGFNILYLPLEFLLPLLPLMFFIAVAILYEYRTLTKDNALLFLLCFLVLIIAGLIPSDANLYRETVFGFLMLSFFAAIGVKHIQKTKWGIIAKPALIILLASFILFNASQSTEKIYLSDVMAMECIKENTEKNAVIAASYARSYAIPAISERRVVIGAFMESVPDAQIRIDDIEQFFTCGDIDCARKVINKYNVSYVYLRAGDEELDKNGRYHLFSGLPEIEECNYGNSHVFDCRGL